MYRVMIVDDADEIRNGLKLKANWRQYGFDVCAEARNGREALDILAEQPVELLITDIRMPVMNGLDLLAACSASHRATKLVVLSGYDDFQYVKRAMQCGAADYLLKPVIGEELEKVIVKVKEALDEEKRQQRADAGLHLQLSKSMRLIREQFILQLAKEGAPSIREVMEKAEHLSLRHWIGEDMCAFIVTVEMRIPERVRASAFRPDLMRTAYQMVCREIAEQYKQEAIAFYDMNFPSMMHFLLRPAPAGTSPASDPNRFAAAVQREANRYLQIDTATGIGRRISSPADMKDGYASALLAWSRNRPDGGMSVASSVPAEEEGTVPDQLERKLGLALERGEARLLPGLIAEWLSPSLRQSMHSFYYAVVKMIFVFDAAARKFQLEHEPFQELLWEISPAMRSFDACDEAAERLLRFGQTIAEAVRRQKASNGEEIVAMVRREIEENYGCGLSLTALADKYYINAAYLSDLFHRQTGITYSQYLFDIRMRHAGRLLRNGDLRIHDIASLVGFTNTGYFCTAFKKQFGVSPAEYRKNQKNENIIAKDSKYPLRRRMI
ncbi:HTH-type transcriptional activator RhaR [Paenibacillus sp. CECT 9249]|uniref:response regulator n=1 Tax=Paenibacillus sp. CECT 9249 TaxID=2845385 RepID=UPI001E4A49BB|nr:response regulator [Paenibacillus sp. CECT 9249]CAH0120668.1 HTH-type transcriptional activator RhaR [Paenibacillus sp. CECT 9249]